ncbi:MAG: 6-oxocyclohex-1-ene-1-carbonyl-CoA hydratase, partial [Planctomycetota bacterium]|nr:6-oxocyclohex-1-ene-1-carbonyl-CoA hydratase [Planctomycetota bacterium]
ETATEMVKGVIAGFRNASVDREVVAVVFTAVGDRAFCTGGNTKEYAEYYAGRPEEYGAYMELFNGMVDSILMCKKPTICRVNGMRVAGGQEIGMACDLAIASDMALFGQAGPRHGSAPEGGASDFLPYYMSIEHAMWSCVSCELWSAYKMYRVGLLTKVVPVLKLDGKFIRNPLVITDKWVEDGEIVYGENKRGDEYKKGKELVEKCQTDFTLLDAEVNKIIWHLANLFPGCVIKSMDAIRSKKRFFWDLRKNDSRHWLAVNMMNEALLGFNAFNTRKMTDKDTIDFIKYRQAIAEGKEMTYDLFSEILPKPKK